MHWIRKTYLYRLYHYQKSLFWIVVFFASATLVCTFRGNQSVPFWVWGMYSAPSPQYDTGSVLLMFNQSAQKIPIYSQKGFKTRFFLHSPLNYYDHARLIENQDPRRLFFQTKLPSHYNQWIASSEDRLFTSGFDQYGEWLKRYLQQRDTAAIENVYILKYHYSVSSNEIKITHIDTTYVF